MSANRNRNRNPVRPVLRAPLMEMFLKRSGQTLYVSDLAKELGRTDHQVRVAINNIKSDHPELGISTVVRGRAYVARPDRDAAPSVPTSAPPAAEPASTEMFRQIGKRKNGGLVLENVDDGTLWEANEL